MLFRTRFEILPVQLRDGLFVEDPCVAMRCNDNDHQLTTVKLTIDLALINHE